MGTRGLTVLNIVEEGRYGGPQHRIAAVAARLRKDHDIETVVLVPTAESERFRDVLHRAGITSQAIRLHRITKHFSHLAGYALFFVSEVLAIGAVVRSVRPDVVHCNGAWQVKGMIAAWLAGVPRVWHMNDSFMPASVQALFDVVYRVCRPNGVIFSARRAVDYYFGSGRRRRPDGTWVIPPPVDTEKFDPTLDWPFPYPDSGFEGTRVLSVGNVNTVKDHELLISLARELNQRGRSTRLRFYVAGSIFANQRAYYEQLCALASSHHVENIVFLGERHDIPALMQHADVFVCTSKHETGPMVMWEALAMEKPAVSTDVGDVRALFEAHHCGLVAKSRSPAELADLLEWVIDRPEEAETMARNGRLAAGELDVGHAAASHAECYRQIAACT